MVLWCEISAADSNTDAVYFSRPLPAFTRCRGDAAVRWVWDVFLFPDR
jgi:hypothetical protein